MVETVGQKLKKTRISRGISLEDAAHHTKIRTPRLADLEKDDISNFPTLGYARSFLQIYARYLEVDITPHLEQFEISNAVSLEGYEYRSGEKDAAQPLKPKKTQHPRLRWSWVIAAMLLLLGTYWGYTLRTNLKRLEGPPLAEPPPVATPTPTATPAFEPIPDPTPEITPLPTPNIETMPEVRRPLAPGETPPPITPPPPSNAIEHEILISPLGSTSVRIVKDQVDSLPVFEGVLEMGAETLMFRGNRFWLTVGDPTLVQVFRDGEPVPLVTTEVFLE